MGRGGGEGRGGALDMGSAPPPLEASSGSAPDVRQTDRQADVRQHHRFMPRLLGAGA